MRVGISRPDALGRRTVILDMSNKEEAKVCRTIYNHVIKRNKRHWKRFEKGADRVRYRFPSQYLTELCYTFPYANISNSAMRFLDLKGSDNRIEAPKLEIPGFSAELYDFQNEAVYIMAQRDRFMLNDEMGLGKTLEALGTICYTGDVPALVICPSNAKWVWKRHVDKFTDLTASVVSGNPRQRKLAIEDKSADITIINFEALRLHPELAWNKYQTIVVDEHHRIKNPSAQVTLAFQKLVADRWIMMSGTPILNRPEEIWTVLNKLWPEKFPDFWLFEKRYCIKDGTDYSSVVGYKNLPELRNFIRHPSRSLRRRKHDVHDDLPEIVKYVRPVELTDEQWRIYRKIEKEFKLLLANGDLKSIKGVLSWITRLRQACFSPELFDGSKTSAKIDELKEVVEELTSNGHKAIIFSQWSKAARIIQRELESYNPAYVDGTVVDTPRRQRRMEEQDRFNNDPDCQIYIGTIGANREAISLSAASYVIFADKTWSPLAHDQAIGRSAAGGLRGIDKLGETVNVIDLLAVDTIEEQVEEVLKEKSNVFDALFEGKTKNKPAPPKLLKTLKELMAA